MKIGLKIVQQSRRLSSEEFSLAIPIREVQVRERQEILISQWDDGILSR